jgi:hypothetical protein
MATESYKLAAVEKFKNIEGRGRLRGAGRKARVGVFSGFWFHPVK